MIEIMETRTKHVAQLMKNGLTFAEAVEFYEFNEMPPLVELVPNKIYQGDAIDLFSSVQDSSIDLVVLDPDYQDWDILCAHGLITEAVRVCKPTGNILCFTKQPFNYNLRNEVGHVFRRQIIWSFSNGGAWVSKKMPLVSFQEIFWLTPTKDFYIDVRTGNEYAEGTKSMKRSKKVWEGYSEDGRNFEKSVDGTWIRDHYHFNKPHCGPIPAKPRQLIDIFIKCFCPIGGMVLDPFFGSGVVGYSCIDLKRRFIGFEIDKSRVDLFDSKTVQQTLF